MEPGQQPGVLTPHCALVPLSMPARPHPTPPQDQHVSQASEGAEVVASALSASPRDTPDEALHSGA